MVIVLLTNVILPYVCSRAIVLQYESIHDWSDASQTRKAQAKEWFEKLLKFEVIKDEDTQVIVVLLFILLLSLVLSSLSIVIYF